MGATNHHTGSKLLVASNGLAHGLTLVGIRQAGVNTLPKRLRERNSLGERKCHRLGRELLSGHDANMGIQTASVNTGHEEAPTSPHIARAASLGNVQRWRTETRIFFYGMIHHQHVSAAANFDSTGITPS